MCMQLNDLDLRNISELTDQLTGVDIFHFMAMIYSMDEDKFAKDVDNRYFFELIDKFF